MKMRAGRVQKIAVLSAGAVSLLFAAIILFSPYEKVNRTWHWAGVVYLLSAVALVSRAHGSLKINKPVAIASAPLSVCFFLMLSVKELLAHPLSGSTVLNLALDLFLIPAGYCVIYVILERFLSPAVESSDQQLRWLKLILLIEGACFLFANYPFRPSADAMDVYYTILGQRLRDWHTITYELYVIVCMFIGKIFGWEHPFMANIVQSILWFIILFRLGNLLRKLYGSRAERNWYILNAVMFIPLMYLGIMYKDVIFSMCLLAFCGEMWYLVSSRETTKADAARIVLSAVFASLFRHGMWIVVMLTLLIAWIYYHRKAKTDSECVKAARLMRRVLAAVIAAVLLVQGAGIYVLHMERNPAYVKFSVPLYICGNIASEHPELLQEEDVSLLEEIMPLSDWKAGYESDTYWADTVSRTWGHIGDAVEIIGNSLGLKIVLLNARILLRSPIVYLNALTKISSVVWQIARPQDGYEMYSAGYYWHRDMPDADPNFTSMDTGVKDFLERLEVSLTDLPILSSVYYRGGIWFFAILMICAILILKKRAALLIVFIPPVLIFFMLMLSCPSQDPRFALPFMEIGMLGLIIARYEKAVRQDI